MRRGQRRQFVRWVFFRRSAVAGDRKHLDVLNSVFDQVAPAGPAWIFEVWITLREKERYCCGRGGLPAAGLAPLEGTLKWYIDADAAKEPT